MGIRAWGVLGCTLALALLVGWALRVDHLRAGWKDRFETLDKQAGAVLAATRTASDNPKLTWQNAAGQIVALGVERKTLIDALDQQNLKIDDMAREAVRLRAKASELKEIADRAEAQRSAALRKLGDSAATPGTRADCMTLLREAEDALDTVYTAGL